ncbi:MAG: GGDEF domain-containing protein [Planctomycetes bacterium]|nr:GGDEF domain-containing protein [Planctomycetota bacterium]
MDNVLIDASLALVALCVGFFSALWYVRHIAPSRQSDNEAAQDAQEKEAQDNDAERANMAALQLRDLAKNVASDVGDHCTLVTDISDELGEITDGSPGSGAAVAQAVSKILTANEKLQNRLADAEQKIQTQAEEIRTQQSEALTDSLTKLANRRAFDNAITKSIDSFNNQRRPFSLLIFDVDHFKNFNDTHGHQAGDEVLRCVGRTMTETVKTTDIPCRYGGEEFALILPNTRIDSARIAAERVRKAIEAMDVEFEGKHLSVTASIGVAEMLREEDDIKLIRRSDDGVYAAKEAGRNQTYWNDGQQCLPLNAPAPQEVADVTDETQKEKSSKPTTSDSDLPNREVFSDELQRRVAESHRFGVSLSVMQISLRDFAKLEKEYGNAVGQLLLDSVAQFIRSSLRDMDLLGQLNAGEFVVMLPGSSEKEAQLVGQRVEKAISNCAIPLGGKELRLEVFPVVTDVYPDDDAQAMIDRVDQMAQVAQEATVV